MIKYMNGSKACCFVIIRFHSTRCFELDWHRSFLVIPPRLLCSKSTPNVLWTIANHPFGSQWTADAIGVASSGDPSVSKDPDREVSTIEYIQRASSRCPPLHSAPQAVRVQPTAAAHCTPALDDFPGRRPAAAVRPRSGPCMTRTADVRPAGLAGRTGALPGRRPAPRAPRPRAKSPRTPCAMTPGPSEPAFSDLARPQRTEPRRGATPD